MARQQNKTKTENGGIQQYTKLEHRLVLLAWLNSLLGYGSNKEMLADTKSAAEGFDADGRSFLYHHLRGRGSQVQIPLEHLERYDSNIFRYLEKINRQRAEPVTLRYFQYMAALYTEIVLDRLCNHRAQLLADLNEFIQKRNAAKLVGEPPDEPFTDSDLSKLAYWMATGSGKTLILHINYYQFLHYNRQPLDNILLITPNEGLSEQHLAELAASGIPAERFDLNRGNMRMESRNTVQVIEITKLVEEKRGGGVSVPVEAFEGRNLIFVDEGHKGSGGEAWRKYRNALAETGFTFEYSATFGQALSAAGDDELTRDYGKAILFDYSYRYFYGDGFGKDFRILNLRDETDEEKTDLLLLGNLLSFYEQLRLFEEQGDALRAYNLEKPLWVFVGNTVNAVYSENEQKRSDVLNVARFLHRVLKNERDWTVKGIEALLKGKSGLVTPDGMDLFAGRFTYLQEIGQTAKFLYLDILKRVFHTPASGGLHLCTIRASAGELGLKAAGAEAYFGLIYIGDTTEFKKLVETDPSNITMEEDALSSSLFDNINQPDTPLNILIGAKKFMEGWNSWRVSNMGLLKIGQHEGSQIIQLFGRGVRLKGKGMSLKRSAAMPGDHPKHIKLLETLNIFAVRANYMAQFRNYLEREGVETEPVIELPLFLWANEQFLQKGLVVPRPQEGREFASETVLLLTHEPSIRPRVDLSVKVQAMESATDGLHETKVIGGRKTQLSHETLSLVDWERAYLEMLEYKERKGWSNLVIPPDVPRKILETVEYTLTADDTIFNPRTFKDCFRLQEAVTTVLRKYLDAFYRRHHEQWDTQNLVYRPLDCNDPNLAFNQSGAGEGKPAYTVRVPASRTDIIDAVKKLQSDLEKLIKEENAGLPRIYFERSLYLPILVKKGDVLSAAPPPLEPSEAQFIRDLKNYWEQEKDKTLKGKEIFLLRNLSRGKGVGFFEERGFYPDFILWVVDEGHQRIIFVEPHGMLHAGPYENDEKARLHERLAELSMEIAKRSNVQNVHLDSFIISATKYEDLHRLYDDGTWSIEKFAEKHILFPNRNEYDYIGRILADPMNDK
ncbi:MAG: DEAD/DEAH box helicase family protein [Chloroflexota bacterium]